MPCCLVLLYEHVVCEERCLHCHQAPQCSMSPVAGSIRYQDCIRTVAKTIGPTLSMLRYRLC